MRQVTRRKFLELVGLTGGAVALRGVLGSSTSRAAESSGGLLLVCFFNGGWDQLLSLDPRDDTDPRFRGSAPYAPTGTGIHPAYEQVQDAGVRRVMASHPGGVQRAGNLTFGPAVPASLLRHAPDLAIVRGIDMETLTHEVGRRYFLTGSFPRGLDATGSSLTAVVAAASGRERDLPNLSVQTESYIEGLPAFASPIHAFAHDDILAMLRPPAVPLPPGSDQLIADYQASVSGGRSPVDASESARLYRENMERARRIIRAGRYELFDFVSTPPPAEVAELLEALQVTPQELLGPKGWAALAGQALARGFAQAVSVSLAVGLDHHSDWARDHATPLRTGLELLGNLISYLKSVEIGTSGQSVWARTTLLAFSEFSRTPLLNSAAGRDHHPASSCLIAGPGVRGDVVVGGTSDLAMSVERVDVTTGELRSASEGGVFIRPMDVHATLLASMGLPYTHLLNREPRLISSLLR